METLSIEQMSSVNGGETKDAIGCAAAAVSTITAFICFGAATAGVGAANIAIAGWSSGVAGMALSCSHVR